MTTPSTNVGTEAPQQQFERVLSLEPFTGLKAILDNVSSDRPRLCEAVKGTKSCEELFAKLGYRMQLIRQIHVQDAFSRVGKDGGIKAVLPYYDIPTQSSFPTLVNFDSTVTATPESVRFFDTLLTALQAKLAV